MRDRPHFRAVLTRLPPTGYAVVAAICATALALGILCLGPRQFGGTDYSSILLHGWVRIAGQETYRDFLTAAPPIYGLGSHAAFALWGVRWIAIVRITACAAAAAVLALTWLLRAADVPRGWSLAVALIAMTATFLPMSAWSFNALNAASGAIYLAAAAALHRRPESWPVRFAFLAAATVLALNKPSMPAVLFVTTSVAFLLTGPRLMPAALLAAAAALWFAVLPLLQIEPLLLLARYREVSSRVGRFFELIDGQYPSREAFHALGILFPFLVAACLPALQRGRRVSENRSAFPFLMFLCGALTTLVAAGTNHDFKIGDSPPLLSGGAIWLFDARRPIAGAVERAVAATSLALLLAFTVKISVTRDRVRDIGPGMFHEDTALFDMQEPPLFAGVLAGPRLQDTLRRTEAILLKRGYVGRRDAPVYFGPRLDFGYAAWGIVPAPRVPSWWEFYPEGDPSTEEGLRLFEEAQFELLFFFRDPLDQPDVPFSPERFREILRLDYEASAEGHLVVLRRRTPASSP